MTKRHVDHRRKRGVLQERTVMLNTRTGDVRDSDWHETRRKYDKTRRVRLALAK